MFVVIIMEESLKMQTSRFSHEVKSSLVRFLSSLEIFLNWGKKPQPTLPVFNLREMFDNLLKAFLIDICSSYR